MKPEKVADAIDKLIDERTKLVTIGASKTLAADLKKSLTEDCRKKILQCKADLLEALKE